ncbi:MAG: chemotaxis protein CheW [Pseudomonadales bacterium]
MQAQDNKAIDSLQFDEGNMVGGQYLTFMLAGEEYGIEILKVQEIKGWDKATPIPNTPDHLLGVLNLRGAVVPIIDLRRRFAFERAEYGPTTVVIVVKMAASDHERTIGLVVDAVADVYRLDDKEVQPPPELGSSVHADFVRGMATVEDKMVILLEVDTLVDFSTVDGVGSEAANNN